MLRNVKLEIIIHWRRHQSCSTVFWGFWTMRNRLAFVIRINVTLVYNKQKCLLQTNTNITSSKSQKSQRNCCLWNVFHYTKLIHHLHHQDCHVYPLSCWCNTCHSTCREAYKGDHYCSSQPLCSIAGRSGEWVTYDLSCMAMQFARVIWGSSTARVGGSISPSKFLDRNIFHLRAGKFVYPVEE